MNASGAEVGSADTVARRADEPFAEWFRRRLSAVVEEDSSGIDRGLAPEFKDAGVLAPFWREGDGVRLALTLRTAHLSSHKGQISFPGGRRDEGESLLDAALRETEEELGIPRSAVEVLGGIDDAWSIQGYFVSPYIGWLAGRPAFVPSADEVERVIVADVEKLMRPSVYRRHRMRHGSGTFYVHYFDYEGDVIWGLTGGILNRLFRQIRGQSVVDASDGEAGLRRFLDVFRRR